MQAAIIQFPASDESMPLNETDKAWIRLEIQSANKKGGFAKVVAFLKDWGLMGGLLIFMLTQYGMYVEFRTKTNDRLDTIEISLRTLNASQSPQVVFKQLASLDAKQLAKNLLALSKVADQSVSKVAPTTAELQDVGIKLRQVNENTTDYWPTVLRFIQLASTSYAANAPPHGSPVNETLKDDNGLDSQAGRVYVLDGGTIANMTFKNSRIIFTDNPTYLKNVTFVDCAFEFPNVDNPTPLMEKTGEQLLASGIQFVSFTGL